MRPMQVGAGKRAPSFDEGSLDQYLREISKYPLIPQEEEVNLAGLIPLQGRVGRVVEPDGPQASIEVQPFAQVVVFC